MKQLFLRSFALLLCLCLLGGAASSLAEEARTNADTMSAEEWEEMDEAFRFVDRFGTDAKVETDADGMPIAVNGYPTQRVRAGFNSLGQDESFQMVIDFLDYPFWRPATAYDGNLAMMSLIMAGCANRAVGFQDVPEGDFDPSLNVENFFFDAGFTDIRKDDYSKVPTMFTVSTAMGRREMTHAGEEPFTLIAVGVCGQGYKNEWESNMTAGTGALHEGFQSAAQLVIDRLAGYIATQGIRGRIKVWISGFSRAAAVSNVVAGTLVNTGFLPKEDVYAYTFATPAAIKNPPREGYENIFNIINPADLIPQVMPAEWGYGRYGTDLFLPVQEFSSYLGSLDSTLRRRTNKNEYDVEYSYSSMLTLRLRLLMSLVLDLTEDAESYVSRFQPALVDIMHDKSLTNTLSILQSLMQNIQLRDREDKTHLDDLIDYFMRVFSGIALRTGYREADSNTGSALFRLMIEHTPNTYLSAEEAIRNGVFEENDRCCYVMARGPVSLTLWDCSNEIEILTLRSDGTLTYSDAFDVYENDEDFKKLFYTENTGAASVICVPMDRDYRVLWTAEQDGTVECIQAVASVRAGSEYPGMASGKIQARAGDTGVAFENVGHALAALDGFSSVSFSARSLAEFLGIASLGFNWRVALTIIYALLGLLICIPLCLIAAHKPSRKGLSFLVWVLLCVLGVAALQTEAAYWFFADQPWVRLIWKGIVAACLVSLFLLLHRKEGSLLRSFFPSLLLAVVADVVISLHFIAGAALFLLCHAVLAYQFLRQQPMSLGKWIQWALVSLALSGSILLFYAPSHGAVGWAAAVYAPVLLLMLFASGSQPIRIRVSAILFFVSDLLLGLFIAVLHDPMIHVVYMFLFYLALLVLTISPSFSKERAE